MMTSCISFDQSCVVCERRMQSIELLGSQRADRGEGSLNRARGKHRVSENNEEPRSTVPRSFGIIRGSLTKGQIISLTSKLSDLWEPPQNQQKSNKGLSAF